MGAPAKQHLFTSESVTEGHPDKVADQISELRDAVGLGELEVVA
jgi:S-adenosylmethionine synthetase